MLAVEDINSRVHTNTDKTRDINFWCWRCEQRSASEIELDRLVTSLAVPGEKRKRTLSVVQLPTPVVPAPNGGTTDEAEHVDIDEPLDAVVCPSCPGYRPQRRDEDQVATPCPALAGYYSCYTDSGAHRRHRTPALDHLQPTPSIVIEYVCIAISVRCTRSQPIASDHFITCYLSRITPPTSYLADPLNSYMHLGMPKTFVHHMGPSLRVALDARQVGNEGRFVRSGCRPNAVLRPVLCERNTFGTSL
jgi:hypothetical protein